jgi:hypothetical protein
MAQRAYTHRSAASADRGEKPRVERVEASVATLIAAELAGPCAPQLAVRRLAPLAAGALLVAALVLWAAPS